MRPVGAECTRAFYLILNWIHFELLFNEFDLHMVWSINILYNYGCSVAIGDVEITIKINLNQISVSLI